MAVWRRSGATLPANGTAIGWMQTGGLARHYMDDLRSFLTDADLLEIGRIDHTALRDNAVANRCLARLLLADLVGGSADEWLLLKNEAGKPSASHPAFGHVSISHSRTNGLVSTALSLAGPVGVDVERVVSHHADDTLAEAFFSARERRYLAMLEAGPAIDAFFQTWTIKEAYIKSIGLGFSVPLQSFSADLLSSPPRLLIGDTPLDTYALHCKRLTEGVEMALAVDIGKRAAHSVHMVELRQERSCLAFHHA